ncbi:MAG TPA: methylenetetrahydrofolate reductase C-terminal domain-containing protein [Coriobacteriia bacterium]|nr:methylenetetrahydrofolate reductase C-terminal domain-containing protein [Coriobacteriia bacterium]
MIITKPRDWGRIKRNLESIGAKRVFLMGCGQCATVAHTGGEKELLIAKAKLEQEGYEVTGWAVGEVACHLNGTKLETRKHFGDVDAADAVLVLTCGAGVQTVADAVNKPVFPALESAFLGTVIRHGVFEERCQTCGDCVLDLTAGICPVTTCPKGLLNGPCGGMWDGKCEVLTDRECTHVRIQRRLAEQGRTRTGTVPPKDYSAKRGPGSVNIRDRAFGHDDEKGGAS